MSEPTTDEATSSTTPAVTYHGWVRLRRRGHWIRVCGGISEKACLAILREEMRQRGVSDGTICEAGRDPNVQPGRVK